MGDSLILIFDTEAFFSHGRSVREGDAAGRRREADSLSRVPGPEISRIVDINVNEGDLYRMGKLRFEGLAQNAADSLRKLWTLKEGEPYDASYPNLFLSSASRQYNLSGLRIEFTTQPRRETKTVDLVLRFEPK